MAENAEDTANPWQEIEEDDALAEAEELLQAQGLEESAVNVQAANVILHGTDAVESADIYSLLAQVMKNLHFEDHTTEDAVDTETEAMAKSLAGADIELPFEPESLLEQLGQGGDLSLTYADLQQQLVEQMYTQAQLGGTSMDFQNLKLVQAGFRILGAMAKRQQYQLPVATETGTKLVNLTLQTDASQRGTIEIQLPSARFGKLSATLHVDEEGTWEGVIVADTSDGNTALQAQAEVFDALLADSSYADAKITLGQSRREEVTNSGQTRRREAGAAENVTQANAVAHPSTQKLCEASVFFVKALAQISDK